MLKPTTPSVESNSGENYPELSAEENSKLNVSSSKRHQTLSRKNFNHLKKDNLSKKMFFALCGFTFCVSVFGYALFFRFYANETNRVYSLKNMNKTIQSLQLRINNLEQKYNNLNKLPTRLKTIDNQVKDLQNTISDIKVSNTEVQKDEFKTLKNDISILSEKVAKITSNQVRSHASDKTKRSWYDRLKNLLKDSVAVSRIPN